MVESKSLELSRLRIEEILKVQINEITEHHIYLNLSNIEKDPEKSKILKKIADEELKHFNLLAKLTGKNPKPRKLKVILVVFLARIFGYQFVLKMMENGESRAESIYEVLKKENPIFESILKDEKEHESNLVSLINEERLQYLSSIVLGLNDGIVELLGTVAGLSFALKKSALVGITAGIMGVAACLSMSASEYLSTKVEKDRSPVRAAIYTAISYLIAVIAVVTPFFFSKEVFIALLISFLSVLILIAVMNFYIAVVRDESFLKRWLEMAGVAVFTSIISFIVGTIVNKYFGVEV